MISLSDIDDAENAVKNIRVVLQGIGREIYLMREGKKLGSEFGFERYIRTNFAGDHFDGQEGPNWGVGTPIFSLRYYWARGADTVDVTFPQGWLEQDWKALEAERLAAERAAADAKNRALSEQAAIATEEAERLNYERLKAKYEGGGLDPAQRGQ